MTETLLNDINTFEHRNIPKHLKHSKIVETPQIAKILSNEEVPFSDIRFLKCIVVKSTVYNKETLNC